ncbi:hypothetical protein [Asaia sp. VD9]|uniref:hypothetical protein n=1 Tax=Asaia sp. VD9 TaxID=3081235 RepID=UPI0030174747
MLNLFRTPYARRVESENERLRLRYQLWENRIEPARTLALIASKDKEIEALKKTIRALKRGRDRAGRFTPCEK